jgi:hypothetical protein
MVTAGQAALHRELSGSVDLEVDLEVSAPALVRGDDPSDGTAPVRTLGR